jgi:hypothetical protein
MKKSLLILSVLGIICLGIICLGMSENPVVRELTERLKTATTEIHLLKLQNSDLRLQIAEYKIQKKDDLIALEPAVFASERGNSTSLWLRNPKHLKNVWKWTKQYKCLLTPEALATAKELNIEYFAFAWFFKESHYCPYPEPKKNKNGTYDWGMAQINDCVWDDCYKHLPDELKKRNNPKQDPEVAVAMLYIWINHRVEQKWSWCYLSDEAWTLVWRLQQING